MRAPVPSSSWLKLTSRLLVAPTSRTGTCTRPKLIEPVQMALGIGCSLDIYGDGTGGRDRRPGAEGLEPRQGLVPGGGVPQGRRDRLRPPCRAVAAPPPCGTTA